MPAELAEAAHVFQLSGWHRFWRLELPYAMSGGWFFVVASEAISVSHQSILQHAQAGGAGTPAAPHP